MTITSSDEHTIPKWFWRVAALALAGAIGWAADISLQMRAIRAEHSAILQEHERRITRLENRNDELTHHLLREPKR